jgi:hypothetical protein
MADSGHSTATLRLTVGTLRIAHPITVPNASVPAAEIVPALQGLVNAVIDAAEAGKTVSCRKGCGACCRQLVPVSRTEGERLLQLVEALPAERRKALLARFAAAEAAIDHAGLKEARRTQRPRAVGCLLRGPVSPARSSRTRAAPSIPSGRLCREYLVTSPAELCAGAAQEGVTPVEVPKISMAARGLQEESDDWFPLALLMAWSRRRPRPARRRPGPEWVQRFLKVLGRK